jgi:hypothetical protein
MRPVRMAVITCKMKAFSCKQNGRICNSAAPLRNDRLIWAKFLVTIQAVIARAFFARSNLVLNRKNHALGDCFTRKKRSFAVTPLFRVDG